jgi:hypothetical protein
MGKHTRQLKEKSNSGLGGLTPMFFADASTQPLDALKYVDGTAYGRSILGGLTLAETQSRAAKSWKNRLLSGVVQVS